MTGWRTTVQVAWASVRSRIGRHRKLLLGVAGVILIVPIVLIAVYRFVEPPFTPLMLIRARQGYRIESQWISLNAIAPVVRRAAVYSEDNQFCGERTGIDFEALDHEIGIWSAGGRPTGASTITMQTGRNLFLWPGRSVIRKLLELWLAPQIALLWPKHRVLEVYLNIVEFGPGIFGVQAAAKHYFGKSASQLNVMEATRLIEVLPNPLHRTPDQLPPEELKRANLATLPVFFGDPEFSCCGS